MANNQKLNRPHFPVRPHLRPHNFNNFATYINDAAVPFYSDQNRDLLDYRQISQELLGSMIGQDFRIYVLYPDETIAYEIPHDIILKNGQYEENYQNGQRRSLSFSLNNTVNKNNVNINNLWAGTKLKFEVGIVLSDKQTIWFDKGVYVITSVNTSHAPENTAIQIEAGDKFSLFEEATGTLSSTYVIPVGAVIEDLIQEILLIDNGSSYPFDPQRIIYDTTFKDKTVQVEIRKSAGDHYGDILLELAQQLSAEMYYNASGNLIIAPISEVSNDLDKPLLYDYSTQLGTISELSFDFNYSEIVNRVIVIGSSSHHSPIIAIAENNDATSPLCVQRLGYRTGNIINDSNIFTRELAQERAEYELRQVLLLKNTLSANVNFNPLLAVNNIVTISDDFFQLQSARFLIQGISYSLDYSGQMSVTLSNLSNLPFLTNTKGGQ